MLPAAGVIWVLGPGAAWWLEHVDGVRIGGKGGLAGKELAAALDAVRGRAMTLGTGLPATVAIYYTAGNAASARRVAEAALRSAGSAEQGLVTDRYAAAIEQLGSGSLDIRLGGISALERIAGDSAHDHPTVMEVLATFLRHHPTRSRRPRRAAARTAGPPRRRAARLRADLFAAANVIGRRTRAHDTHIAGLSRLDLSRLDLTEADR
jgi:hypothetical protein